MATTNLTRLELTKRRSALAQQVREELLSADQDRAEALEAAIREVLDGIEASEAEMSSRSAGTHGN